LVMLVTLLFLAGFLTEPIAWITKLMEKVIYF